MVFVAKALEKERAEKGFKRFGQTTSGIMPMDDQNFKDTPDHWMSYLHVDDIDQAISKARETGATIIREPFDVENIDRIAILEEPGGAAIGWMTPAN